LVGAAAVAAVGSSHPASSSAMAANINAAHADCERSLDIETAAPNSVRANQNPRDRDGAMIYCVRELG
jgi:hypothetical protein